MTANKSWTLLFVCTGNIGRSPIAQFLAERLARERGLPWKVISAGIEATLGCGLESGAQKVLASRGIKGAFRLARQLDEAMLAEATQVYALTRAHRAVIISRFPAHAAKVSVLREAAGLSDVDVRDPYGAPDAVYEECAARIEEALDVLIRRNSRVENSR